jgi:hypothetical protein
MKKVMFTALAVGLSLTANVMAQVPSYVPTNGLVGWWPFNGNANDESGNGNNGTVNGATLTADRFGNAGKAYSFDGVDQWIEIMDNLSLKPQNTISISGWAVLDSLEQSNFPRLINKAHNQSENYSSYQIIGGNRGQDSLGRSGFTIRTTSSYNWTGHGGNVDLLNTWFYFTAIYNGQQMKYYIDGQLVKSINQIGSIVYNNENLFFAKGKDGSGNADYTKCLLDDIGIWNRPLTDQEISDLYNANICYEYVTVTDTLVINTGITGYNPITYLNTLKIWPNPSNDHITIDAGNLATMNGYSIKIEDAQGQQVFQNAVNQQQFYVDITTWGGNGLYFVRIIDPQGNTVDIKKIVLQ